MMPMEKYKRCPQCGEHVSPTLFECPRCEADLFSVPVVDGEESQPETPPPPRPAPLIRRCDCGAENPPQARKCRVCGEDLSDIAPTAVQARPRTALVTSLDGQWTMEICAQPVVLGREQPGCEYLRARAYVSRQQARLVMEDGEMRITSLSRSNPTFINNAPLQTDEVRALRDGDEIGLGGCEIDGARQDMAAYLRVRLNGAG